MLKDLENSLNEYKKLSLDILEVLAKNDVDSLELLFNLRQKEIDEINEMNFTKEDFSTLLKKLDLLVLDEKIKLKIQEMQGELINEMNKFAETKIASKSYSKSFSVDSIYLNKKY